MLMVAQALVVVSALLAAAAAATAAEYVRPPPGRIILTEHTEPAAHPQQVHTLHYTFLFTTDATVLYVTRLIKLRSMSTDPVYSQVHVSAVGEKHVRVSWVTDDMRAQSVVDYGKASRNYTASATGEHTSYRYFLYSSGKIHHVSIGPLEPSTVYYYRCGKAGKEFSLRTPPAALPIELALVGTYLGTTGRGRSQETTKLPRSLARR
jgi:acid phosphatase type 7